MPPTDMHGIPHALLSQSRNVHTAKNYVAAHLMDILCFTCSIPSPQSIPKYVPPNIYGICRDKKEAPFLDSSGNIRRSEGKKISINLDDLQGVQTGSATIYGSTVTNGLSSR